MQTQFNSTTEAIPVSASDLHESETYSFLNFPLLGKYAFLNHPGLNTLQHCLQSVSIPDETLVDIALQLRNRMVFLPSFHLPDSTETNFVSVNADYVIDLLLTLIQQQIGANMRSPSSIWGVSKKNEVTTQQGGPFVLKFCTTRSRSELVIWIHNSDSVVIGIAAGEFEGIPFSPFKGIAQGVQISCDLLYNLVRRTRTVRSNKAIVPFFNFFGDSVQIGVTISLSQEPRGFYPIPLLLTRPLSLFLEEDLKTLVHWFYGFVDYLQMSYYQYHMNTNYS
jgi:hypothetical protein